MPRIRHTLRFPSYRNLQIYHALAYQRRTQTALAQSLGISQRRVSQIGQQVRGWVDRILRPREFAGHDGLRFHLAIARERIRLRDAYEPLAAMFTGPDGFPRFLRRHVAVVNGESLSAVEVSGNPDFRLLSQPIDVASRQAELEAIANQGPLPELPGQVHRTTTHGHLPSTATVAPTNTQENRGLGVL
jgi:hypothetical protein